MILAIDPGFEVSTAVVWDGRSAQAYRDLPNRELLNQLRSRSSHPRNWAPIRGVVIEKIESYGMPVGADIFQTVFWSGRFVEAWGKKFTEVSRRDVKLHLCGDSRAKDTNIRQALIDRFGPGRALAIGTKSEPGPLYGVASHAWSALAVAVTFNDRGMLWQE